jgi:hypothetical protein
MGASFRWVIGSIRSGGFKYMNLPDLAETELKKLEATLGSPILPLHYKVETEFDNRPQLTGNLTVP